MSGILPCNRKLTLVTGGLAVGLASAITQSAAGDPPATITLPGIVRDFHKSDSDFVTMPSNGTGHYAGNLALTTDAMQRPQFNGSGAKVSTQWRDMDSNNIAPHLFHEGALRLASAPTLSKNTVVDTWDSSLGPYGGTNVGPAPSMDLGGAMPSVSAPVGLGTVGAYVVGSNATININSSFQCSSFSTGQNGVINVSGHCIIYSTGNVLIGKNTVINIQPNSSLNLYFVGTFDLAQGSSLNMNTMTPSLCRVFNLGNNTITFNQDGKICAQVTSPNGSMHLKQNDEFFGRFQGKTFVLDQGGQLHYDGVPSTVCGSSVLDTAGAYGATDNGGIGSANTFNRWFNDSLGFNLSNIHTITLTRNASGIYEFLESEFFPIDDQLFGNEGDDRNYYFTYEIDITFTHRACQKTFFEFEGDDDAWLFVDGRLAMDLGGVMPSVKQYVPIDRITGLVDGQTYRLQFFYAQRQNNRAVFRMRTNLEINAPDSPYVINLSGD